MGPGTLYGTVHRLVGDGLVEETRVDQDQEGRRRDYALMPSGRAVAAGRPAASRACCTDRPAPAGDMTLYGGLLRLYPRSFREEYGEGATWLGARRRRPH